MKKLLAHGRVVWSKWLHMARIIGNVQLRIIFSLFYLFFFSILGVIFRFFIDPMKIKTENIKGKKSGFVPWDIPAKTLAQLQKPF